MARLEVPPTKTSLRRIKENLAFAYEGFDLLNRKREILVMEIMRNVKTIQKIESQFRRSLEELYHSYRVAAVEMGSSALTMKSCSEKRGYYLRTYTSRLMGLSLTGFQVKTKKMRQLTGFAGTTAAYDEAREKCLGLLSLVADYATATKS
ncbi:MAG: hypothetical protein GY868_21250, partial [Deltaproteobacteria bacterium]|nr:hypothetical protein [Deltaproteobacteria bacterium]